MPKGKISMGKKTPAPIGKQTQRGRASIYKGTDKTTNKKDRVRSGSQDVIYADGSRFKMVPLEIGGGRPGAAGKNSRVYSEKKGNTITSYTNTNSPYINPRTGGLETFPYHNRTITTLGEGGRRESVLKRSGQNNSANYVVSETQLNRGSGTRKTGAKKKAY